MLNEIKNIKQYDGEPQRRWFFDPSIDLLIWSDEAENIVGFQLTYDRPSNPKAFAWGQETGYVHNRIDDGECLNAVIHKGTTILLSNAVFDIQKVATLFEKESRDIDPNVSAFVFEKIMNYTENK